MNAKQYTIITARAVDAPEDVIVRHAAVRAVT